MGGGYSKPIKNTVIAFNKLFKFFSKYRPLETPKIPKLSGVFNHFSIKSTFNSAPPAAPTDFPTTCRDMSPPPSK